jgi:hypothetical protein
MSKLFRRLGDKLSALHQSSKDPERAEQLKTTASIVVVLVLVAAGLSVVWYVPKQQVANALDSHSQIALQNQERLKLEDEFRKTIAQIVLSVFGLLLLYFTWRRARAGDATVRVMEQGHITDRYTKAIEQLGKTDGTTPNIEVRLGAIYALERLALDSPRDHWTIMEVLTAYVRRNAPREPDRPYEKGEIPRTDIQAVLTVLGRRKTGNQREHFGPGTYLTLMPSRLCGANLTNASLQNADLENVNLQGASLWGAKLQGAALRDANLEQADCKNAKFAGTFFTRTRLGDANIEDADFRGARELTIEQIQSARNWQRANYSPDFRARLGLLAEDTGNPSSE